MEIKLKRIYEAAEKSDGTRVLVDRLWPRGVSKVEAQLDLWLKDVAPSSELRKWFGHDPDRWAEFQRRYRRELSKNHEAVEQLAALAHKGRLTLLYGAKDETHNEAVVLKEFMENHAVTPASRR